MFPWLSLQLSSIHTINLHLYGMYLLILILQLRNLQTWNILSRLLRVLHGPKTETQIWTINTSFTPDPTESCWCCQIQVPKLYFWFIWFITDIHSSHWALGMHLLWLDLPEIIGTVRQKDTHFFMNWVKKKQKKKRAPSSKLYTGLVLYLTVRLLLLL